MQDSTLSLERVGTIAAYSLLGALGTAAVALAILNAGEPVQRVIYALFYLQVGPSDATRAAVLTHFLIAGFAGSSVALLAGDYLGDRLEHATELARGIGALLGLVAVFLLTSLAGLAAFLTALLVLAAAVVAVPLLFRYRYGVRSGAVAAFVGGIPVLVLLFLAAGFGIGWGWGYTVAAQEVPESAVDGTPSAAFEEVPQVRDDLFAGDCRTDTDDRRVCRLYLRGYEHEVAAARFMDRHGVRCPYQNAGSGSSGAFLARHNGSYYRVTCSPHGD